ncbi:hypothetical protein [Arcanobacterium bovis]|uniref:Leucine-binding protein domain-containing protein n=1 Tax=Arcanobacterium bovis TaxID=2529275 RepID=A0A4Q9V197_9ACTO|nr:hypothetical protein [Arcanobacterium bovis]TBW22864.1 hypothetical protein EZJ44_02915 [Arcanobacterium bovis]
MNTIATKRSNMQAIIAFVVMFVVIGIGLVAPQYLASNHENAPLVPPLEIEANAKDDNLLVGIVVSYTDNPDEGAGWSIAGEGASVALWRLKQGDSNVSARVISDNGNEVGARSAVATLKQDKAAAIIALTTGSHTKILASEAAAAGIPVIFPYEKSSQPASNAWYFRKNEPDFRSMSSELSHQLKCAQPVVIEGDGRVNAPKTGEVTVLPGQESAAVAEVIRLHSQQQADCLFLDVNAKSAAEIIKQTRANNIDFPIVGSFDLLNPLFQQSLGSNIRSIGAVYSIGTESTNVMAMKNDSVGARAGIFNHAVRLMKDNKSLRSFDTSKPFAEVSGFADSWSHDAILAAVGLNRADELSTVNFKQRAMEFDSAGLPFINESLFNSAGNNSTPRLLQATVIDGRLSWFYTGSHATK